VLFLYRERARTLVQLVKAARLFFQAPATLDPKAVKKYLGDAEAIELLRRAQAAMQRLEVWMSSAIETALHGLAAEKGVPFDRIAQPVRVALSGTAVSPPIHQTLELLGKAESLKRMAAVLAAQEAEKRTP
jgi:glutamyl-tRNA synthetase